MNNILLLTSWSFVGNLLAMDWNRHHGQYDASILSAQRGTCHEYHGFTCLLVLKSGQRLQARPREAGGKSPWIE